MGNLTTAQMMEMSAIESVIVNGQNMSVFYEKNMDSLMNKGSKSNRNPFIGRCIELQKVSGVCIKDYQSSCEREAEKVGQTFVGGESNHIHFSRCFEVDKRTESKAYIPLQHTDAQEGQPFYKVERHYYLDGRKVSKEYLFSLISAWLKPLKKTAPHTQTDAGITNTRWYKCYALENVVKICQGKRTWRRDFSTWKVTHPSVAVSA